MTQSTAPTRPYYAVELFAALRAMDGAATPQDVFGWLEANDRIRENDRAELTSGGPRWRKEIYFGAMMLVRSGLIERRERGIWRFTDAGNKIDLTPRLAAALLDATKGSTGPITLERTYAAIRDAARARRFISYADLARANGAEWSKVRRLIPQMLGRLMILAHVRAWPMLSAIVVNKESVETGTLEGPAREGFLAAARMVGIDPGDPETFVRDQQLRVFEWGRTAPERLGAEGRGGSDEDQGEDKDTPPASAQSIPAAAEPGRQYWLGGAQWGGSDDQMDRFRAEAIWQSGDDEQAHLVAQIRRGDRIAIKAAFVRKHRLPFDAAGESVSAMRIKATGTVIGNRNDGRTVDVAWDPPVESRDWYFYTFRKTLARLDPGDDHARRLIAFVFGGAKQDYDWWLRLPYFAGKYGNPPEPAIMLPDEAMAAGKGEDADLPTVPSYTVASIVSDGCFLEQDDVEEILARLLARKNIVLQGPPGTGKSWLARRLGYALIGAGDAAAQHRLQVVQFHPSMSYEDFVRGWRPDSEGKLSLRDGIFLRAVDAARADPDPFVLVIEEINRGNPAQIFGELLTLIEDSKRRPEEALELAYAASEGERVHVPDNLYIIGTMNVADRSLALVDLALRRRFAFIALEPRFGPAWRRWAKDRGAMADALLDLIEARLVDLNRRIAEDRGLGPQFRIGHSYVTPTAPVGDGAAWFRRKIDSEIVPLLDEYWYDQPERVAEARGALMAGL